MIRPKLHKVCSSLEPSLNPQYLDVARMGRAREPPPLLVPKATAILSLHVCDRNARHYLRAGTPLAVMRAVAHRVYAALGSCRTRCSARKPYRSRCGGMI